ncbi:pantoate--beta-alanine ligase [Falsibacillus pallidus]|uniref:Pantothenate synthetase n=1 Tax=Falsibacillus pallidus TaxID=493781 RepID=A0A370GGU2_9BACI|nr:pantoate--beta-alanine ligase [Falsibacillus pallidus]RDI43018.1 pantoate--beta-alanine ligase [Falsibacillus pallidus]
MKIIATISDLKQHLKKEKVNGSTIGFVPTMGFLHEGHVSLMEASKKENDVSVISIFVNPLQFGPNEDFESYPRDLERDARIAENAGVDFLFAPLPEEMYPARPSISIHVKDRVDVLCGSKREGHFDGVAAVLTKLFNIVQPDRVYFGLKDAQQVAVVDGLINDFNIPVELRAMPTIREEDGLAKSSRNVRLSPDEREMAPVIYQSLKWAEEAAKNGVGDEAALISGIKERIENETSGEIDYIEIYSYPSLKKMDVLEGKFIIAAAVKFSDARLIDNIIISAGA